MRFTNGLKEMEENRKKTVLFTTGPVHLKTDKLFWIPNGIPSREQNFRKNNTC